MLSDTQTQRQREKLLNCQWSNTSEEMTHKEFNVVYKCLVLINIGKFLFKIKYKWGKLNGGNGTEG